MDKQIKLVVKAAVNRGWAMTHGGKHLILIHSSGRKVSASVSPSCNHAYKNLQKDIDKVEREQANK